MRFSNTQRIQNIAFNKTKPLKLYRYEEKQGYNINKPISTAACADKRLLKPYLFLSCRIWTPGCRFAEKTINCSQTKVILSFGCMCLSVPLYVLLCCQIMVSSSSPFYGTTITSNIALKHLITD